MNRPKYVCAYTITAQELQKWMNEQNDKGYEFCATTITNTENGGQEGIVIMADPAWVRP